MWCVLGSPQEKWVNVMGGGEVFVEMGEGTMDFREPGGGGSNKAEHGTELKAGMTGFSQALVSVPRLWAAVATLPWKRLGWP